MATSDTHASCVIVVENFQIIPKKLPTYKTTTVLIMPINYPITDQNLPNIIEKSNNYTLFSLKKQRTT